MSQPLQGKYCMCELPGSPKPLSLIDTIRQQSSREVPFIIIFSAHLKSPCSMFYFGVALILSVRGFNGPVLHASVKENVIDSFVDC